MLPGKTKSPESTKETRMKNKEQPKGVIWYIGGLMFLNKKHQLQMGLDIFNRALKGKL